VAPALTFNASVTAFALSRRGEFIAGAPETVQRNRGAMRSNLQAA
jgi:hypothetical protein